MKNKQLNKERNKQKKNRIPGFRAPSSLKRVRACARVHVRVCVRVCPRHAIAPRAQKYPSMSLALTSTRLSASSSLTTSAWLLSAARIRAVLQQNGAWHHTHKKQTPRDTKPHAGAHARGCACEDQTCPHLMSQFKTNRTHS